MKKTAYDESAVLVPSRTFDTRVLAVARNGQMRAMKLRANTFLEPTDWYTIRQVEEPDKRIPDSIKDARKVLRDSALDQAALIAAATTLAELDDVLWAEEIEGPGLALNTLFLVFLAQE